MAGINVGSVFMDAYINTTGFTAGVDQIKSFSNNAFAGISNMIITEWTKTKTQTDTKMKEMNTAVSGGFLSMKGDTETKMTQMTNGVKGSFDLMKSRVFNNMLLAKAHVGTEIDGMKTKFGELAAFLTGDFNTDWSKAFTAINQTFGTVWEGMPGLLKTAVNGCIKMMNGFIGGIWRALKGVVDVIGDLISEFGSLIGFEGMGFSMPEAPQIPMLAKGGIIRQPTLAMVGESGKEAVMPLENNTGWMVELANTLGAVMAANAATAGTSGGSSENIARLYVDGKQLAETIFDHLSDVTKRRGMDLKAVSL